MNARLTGGPLATNVVAWELFSHWDGDHCVVGTPVRVTDIGDLASLDVGLFLECCSRSGSAFGSRCGQRSANATTGNVVGPWQLVVERS